MTSRGPLNPAGEPSARASDPNTWPAAKRDRTPSLLDGKVRMVKVFTNNGSNATFSLGAISWSGAVVESSGFGPNCITFPGSSTGVVVKGKQGGESWSTTHRW